MKHIVIFGGTTEGRELAEALAGKPLSLTVCVATEYGREEQGELPGVEVHSGRLDAAGMETLLREADLCVDATHPYAKEVSKNIRTACESSGTPYRRLLRKASLQPESAVTVDSAKAAAEYLKDKAGNVLLTTGSKELASYEGMDRQRLFPRVLPLMESLQLCEAAEIPHKNILALQGPFSRELNEAIIRQYGISWLVTKDGGAVGGFAEKVEAAENTGARLVVIARPEETGLDFETVLRECEDLLWK